MNQSEIVQGLNNEQLQAVNHTTGPLLVVAGAGTGKTEVLTRRIVNLCISGTAKPSEILALTFTDKAASEMQNRVDVAMPLSYDSIQISTFHGFCEKLLREFGVEIGLPSKFKIASTPQQWMLLRQNIFDLNLKYHRPLGNPTKFIGDLLSLFSRAKDEAQTPQDYLSFASKLSLTAESPEEQEEATKQIELAEAYQKYQELLVQEDMLDFGDLILYSIKLLKERASVRATVQERYKFIMVDEYQDTNFAQNELVSLIAAKNQNICVVGDDDQSIYKFRGAAVSNILGFEKQYPGAATVVLSKNYRSKQEIIDLAYKVIQNNNPDRLEHKNGINKHLTAQNGSGGVVELLYQSDAEAEAEAVALKIEELINEKEYNFADIAILARTNASLDLFAATLRAHDLAFALVSARGLYNQPEVQDAIAYLKFLTDPYDSISLFRVLSLPIFNLKATDLLAYSHYAKLKNKTIFEILSQVDIPGVSAEGRDSITQFLELTASHMTAALIKSPWWVAYLFYSETGYVKSLLTPESAENTRKINNINIFLKRIKEYETEEPTARAKDFITYLEFLIEAGENPAQAQIEDADVIKLTTTHSAKGLEFSVVFLVNLVNEKFPAKNRGETLPLPAGLIKEELPEGDFHIQEERRLFYVGLTRAKQELYLTYANKYSAKKEAKPSRFLVELYGDNLPKDLPPAKLNTFDLHHATTTPTATFDFVSHIKNLSFSHIDTFEQCPLKFKYRFVYNIPTPPEAALTIGNTVHNALRDYYELWQAGSKGDLTKLLTCLEERWVSEGFDSPAHEAQAKKEATEWLTNLYDQDISRAQTAPAYIEKSFLLKIGDMPIKGTIDRVDQLGEGQFEIIDYKTGEAKELKDVAKNKQLELYALAFNEVFGHLPEKLSLYFIKDGQKVTVKKTAADLERTRRELVDVVERIKQSDFAPTKNFLCSYCAFKPLCPLWQES